jgi:hypothetical protein
MDLRVDPCLQLLRRVQRYGSSPEFVGGFYANTVPQALSPFFCKPHIPHAIRLSRRHPAASTLARWTKRLFDLRFKSFGVSFFGVVVKVLRCKILARRERQVSDSHPALCAARRRAASAITSASSINSALPSKILSTRRSTSSDHACATSPALPSLSSIASLIKRRSLTGSIRIISIRSSVESSRNVAAALLNRSRIISSL